MYDIVSRMQKQKKVLPILFTTLMLDMIGIGMIIPIIPSIFTDPTSASFVLHGYSQNMQYFIAGLITTVFGFMQFFAAPLLGELSDIYGRKKLLMMGVGVLALSQLLFGFGVLTASLVVLLISRIVAGLAGGNFSIAQAVIADVSEPQNRAKNFGLMGAAFGLGFIVGPLLGGWLAGAFHSAAAPFWFAGALGIINMLLIFILLPETHHNRRAEKNFTLLKGFHNIKMAFQDVDAKPMYWTSFLYMCGFSFFTSFISVLLLKKFGLSEAGIGTFFGAVGLWMIITQVVFIRLFANKFTEKKILRVTILLLAATIAIYPLLPNLTYAYTVMPFMAIAQGLSMAYMGALISKSVSAEKQGAALGINASLQALSQGIIPLIAGIGSGVIGLVSPFIAGAVLVVIAWFVLFSKRT